MNNTIIKNIAFAASGALFGALGGYLVAGRVLSKKLEEELKDYKESQEAHMKAMKLELDTANNKIEVYESAGLKFETAIEIAKKNKEALEAKDKQLTEKEEEMKKTYTRLVNYAKREHNVQDEANEEPEEDTLYLISVDQFSEEHDEFRKLSCVYYTEDNVLCEVSHGEKISVDNVGRDNLDMLLGDVDILYVRNEKLGIDYEIEKYVGSYAYEVMGEESLNE